MERNKEKLEAEKLFISRMIALSTYHSKKSIIQVEKDFPSLVQFVMESKDRNFREVEKELYLELEQKLKNL